MESLYAGSRALPVSVRAWPEPDFLPFGFYQDLAGYSSVQTPDGTEECAVHVAVT